MPEERWEDSLRGELTDEPAYVAPTSAVAAFAQPSFQPAIEEAPRRKAPRAWALPLDAPTVSTAAKQRPLARRRPNPTRQAWVSEAKRNVSRKTPRYLVNVESKIKDQLNAHRARLKKGTSCRSRRARRFVQYSSSRGHRGRVPAVEAPQWDSTIDDAALDDYGLPADDQPVPDYQPPRRKEGERPDYSSWVGDYGPVNAKGEKPMPPADGEEAARDLAAPADVDAALQAAAAAPAETAEEADDDALDEAFLREA